MPRFPFRAALAAALLVAPAARAQAPAAPEGARTRHVVVISIDGLRPDALEAAGARNLLRFRREGAWAPRARTILPSLTLPSHTSMLTGVGPEVHGILWNDDQTGRTGPVGVPTVFDLAGARGLATAGFFGKPKFRHLIRPGSPRWRLAPRGGDIWQAVRIVEEVEQHLRWRRPNLLFVHLADPDVAGHVFGWMSPRYRAAVRRSDAAVGRIVRAAGRALGDDVVFIVTADHGGVGRRHGADVPEQVRIPWIAWGEGVARGEVEGEVVTYDTAATALWLLGVAIPEDWAGKPVRGAFEAAVGGR
ncbi:MAG TPA: ectonucleotide pyrophosphatase/phosphodiesterase [Longimicrobium sp.]|nr:ectonucleotide pyrophosphatase/phosphodiesterase [Longimicrobium sp.]